MNLIDRIARLLRRSEPPPETTTVQERPSGLSAGLGRFQADVERRRIIETCRRMYDTDTRAKRTIRVLARDIVGGGFDVTADDPRAEEMAQALLERLSVAQRLDDWIRQACRDGDVFLEMGVDAQLEIAEITRKPTLQMHRNSDEFDRFRDPGRAYWWADDMWIGEPPPDAVWFAAWQLIHARWDHDEGSRYGTPMFASGTGAWKRVTEGEVDIAVRRKTRAGMKFLHVVEGADEQGLQAYKESNKEALNNPFAAVADFFTNRQGMIQAIQGDAHLGEIADVQHHISTWLMASDVPMELLGYGENLNRDVLGEKKEEYDETLETLRGWVEADIVRPLLELQWLLQGIWPRGLQYEITWKAKQALRPADLRDVADAAMRLRMLGWPDEAIATVLGRFLPGVDLSFMVAIRDDGEGTPGQVATTLARLTQMIGR